MSASLPEVKERSTTPTGVGLGVGASAPTAADVAEHYAAEALLIKKRLAAMYDSQQASRRLPEIKNPEQKLRDLLASYRVSSGASGRLSLPFKQVSPAETQEGMSVLVLALMAQGPSLGLDTQGGNLLQRWHLLIALLANNLALSRQSLSGVMQYVQTRASELEPSMQRELPLVLLVTQLSSELATQNPDQSRAQHRLGLEKKAKAHPTLAQFGPPDQVISAFFREADRRFTACIPLVEPSSGTRQASSPRFAAGDTERQGRAGGQPPRWATSSSSMSRGVPLPPPVDRKREGLAEELRHFGRRPSLF